METEQFSLCWNNFHNNLRTGFHSLLQDEDLVDVTLAAEGRYIKAHKTVLSVCSPYFKELFKANPCKHPIVILQDVKYSALHCLLQFMYQGEVSVSQDEIPTFMRVAETLKIKGLTENNSSSDTETNGVANNNFHRSSPFMYGNLEPRQIMKRSRPTKKVIRPIQHLRPLESPKTVKSPASIASPQSVSSPQPPPLKKPCMDEVPERIPEYVNPTINPKQEPIDDSEDDYKGHYLDDSNLDMSAMLDTTLSEPSHPSASWTPDLKVPADTSSPGARYNLEKLKRRKKKSVLNRRLEKTLSMSNVGSHLPVVGTRRRCAYCSSLGKEKRSNLICQHCQVALCKKCFIPYHCKQ